jgi:hypothetical protein
MTSGQISTWSKAKDALLMALLGIVVVAAGRILSTVEDMRKDLAVFQANQSNMKSEIIQLHQEHSQLRSEFNQHVRERK